MVEDLLCGEPYAGENPIEPWPPVDAGALLSRAETGDVEAQAELAYRLYNGDGVPVDTQAAFSWARRAADGGDAWAQTTIAILLRKTTDPDAERESITWLEKAAAQGDARARFNLGLQQMEGIGTALNPIEALANAVMASLSGFEEARKFVGEIGPKVDAEQWNRIASKVQWPNLMIALGPPADGTMTALYAKFVTGTDEQNGQSEWLMLERKEAEALFMGQEGNASILEAAFNAPATVRKLYVGRGIVGGEHVAVITIRLDDIRLADGSPVYQKPNSTVAAVGPLVLQHPHRYLTCLRPL
jgi:hypothetical protein